MNDDPPRRPDPASPLVAEGERSLPERPDEPPVVARLMIEIRSDGRRTIARGAMEDALQGEKVAIEARGTSPASLAASLIKSLLSGPLLTRVAARAAASRLLGGRRR
jgi:hypothetical protein